MKRFALSLTVVYYLFTKHFRPTLNELYPSYEKPQGLSPALRMHTTIPFTNLCSQWLVVILRWYVMISPLSWCTPVFLVLIQGRWRSWLGILQMVIKGTYFSWVHGCGPHIIPKCSLRAKWSTCIISAWKYVILAFLPVWDRAKVGLWSHSLLTYVFNTFEFGLICQLVIALQLRSKIW